MTEINKTTLIKKITALRDKASKAGLTAIENKMEASINMHIGQVMAYNNCLELIHKK